MRFLPDTLLYTDTNHCLARLREWRTRVDSPKLTRIPVHFYWTGPLGAKQALSIKSLLATHDPSLTECWLWLDSTEAIEAAHANRHFSPLLPLLKIKLFQLESEVRDTPFDGQDWLKSDLRPPAVSDIARLVILYNHGGLYADIDTMFLRDINELRACIDDAECGYQWSYVPRVANAFLRLRASGPVVAELMHAACAARSAHSNPMLSFDRKPPIDFLVLPSAAFSPLWLRVDGKDRAARAPFSRFSGFFRRFGWIFRRDPTIRSVGDFFPGAFTYHWHNMWNAPEHTDSYAGLLDGEFNRVLRSRHPALAPLPSFGESISDR